MNVRHFIYILLFGLAVAVQWPLWFGKGGVFRMYELENELSSIRAANERLRNENDNVAAEIESLESGSGAVEERARMRLGMIRNDEILFRFVPKSKKESLRQPEETVGTKSKQQVFSPKRSDLYIEGEVLRPVPKKKVNKK